MKYSMIEENSAAQYILEQWNQLESTYTTYTTFEELHTAYMRRNKKYRYLCYMHYGEIYQSISISEIMSKSEYELHLLSAKAIQTLIGENLLK